MVAASLGVLFTLVLLVISHQSGSSSAEAFTTPTTSWVGKIKQATVSITTTKTSSSSSPRSSSGGAAAAAALFSSSKSSLESSLQWWEDLAPPFAFPPAEVAVEEEEDDVKEDGKGDNSNKGRPHESVDVVHFCFLVHGYRGYSRDLSYLQTVMERIADKELKKQQSSSSISSFGHDSSSSLLNQQSSDVSSTTTSISTSTTTSFGKQDVVVHSPVCNEKRTDDGVTLGGVRLVEEIREFIHAEMRQRKPATILFDADNVNVTELPKITISMLGNSLGGLYARYAIAKLYNECKVDEKTDELILDGKYRLALNIFCTTATPHLGVAGHTFVPLPRSAEVGVAQVMRDTGKDLFRCNDLLRRMATTAEYLKPLGEFRQRIAYANAYGTDFPVPVHTAAFLNEGSTSPHYFLENDNNNTNEKEVDAAEADGLIIAKVYTPRRAIDLGSSTGAAKNATDSNILDEEIDESLAWAIDTDKIDELEIMSQTLDTLGWKKVFVDARKNMPKIPLFGLSASNRSSSSNLEDGSNSEDDDLTVDDRQARSACIARLKQKGIVESRDLVSAVTAPLFDEHFHWPVGHNMIVAFSRSRLSTYLNKAGRPVVDSIARNLIQEILDWPVEEGEASTVKEEVVA